MITFHCTAKLTKRFGLKHESVTRSEPTSLLGNWSANLFNVGSHRWVLCLNDETNLPVLVRARKADFPEEFPVELGLVLRLIGVPSELAALESQRSSQFRFTKAVNRSILGSLNDMAYHMGFELERRGDPVAAAAALSEMPCRLRDVIFPGQKVFELLGIPSQYDRGRNRRLFDRDIDEDYDHVGVDRLTDG